MDKENLDYFKARLLKEKQRIQDTLHLMEKNETINSNAEFASELSFYDNHPADLGEEIADIEKGRALKGNEMSIINKIEEALNSIEKGNYGVCKVCGIKIPHDRLEFIPYAVYCVNCQNKMNDSKPIPKNDRPIEETVLGKPFGYGFNDYKDDIEFDAEDSYQAVARFNNVRYTPDYYDDDDEGYIDPIEKISNQQYKNQLPD
jgi:YteA family regulatory protein